MKVAAACLLALLCHSLSSYHGACACSLVGMWCEMTTLTYHNQMLARITGTPETGLVLFAATPIPNWGSGAVLYNSVSSTVNVTLDDGESVYGEVSANCSVITWINSQGPGEVE